MLYAAIFGPLYVVVQDAHKNDCDYWDLGLVVRVDPNISNTDQSKYFQVFTITYSYYIHPNFSISQKKKFMGEIMPPLRHHNGQLQSFNMMFYTFFV